MTALLLCAAFSLGNPVGRISVRWHDCASFPNSWERPARLRSTRARCAWSGQGHVQSALPLWSPRRPSQPSISPTLDLCFIEEYTILLGTNSLERSSIIDFVKTKPLVARRPQAALSARRKSTCTMPRFKVGLLAPACSASLTRSEPTEPSDQFFFLQFNDYGPPLTPSLSLRFAFRAGSEARFPPTSWPAHHPNSRPV